MLMLSSDLHLILNILFLLDDRSFLLLPTTTRTLLLRRRLTSHTLLLRSTGLLLRRLIRLDLAISLSLTFNLGLDLALTRRLGLPWRGSGLALTSSRKGGQSRARLDGGDVGFVLLL
jgi:hypothetical protein